MSVFPAVRPAVSPAVRGAFEQSYGGGAVALIKSLFAQGQQGFWLPFTDFASLSQDSAGTLPYTALEQPVGRVLDRSGRGNHASQVTSTARGAVGARGNALLNTDNPAAWGYAGTRFSVGSKDVDDGWPLTHILAASIAVNTDYPIGASGVTDATIVRSIELQAGTASFATYGAASGSDAVTIDLVAKTIVTNVGGLPVSITALPDNWVRAEFWSSRASFSASLLSNYLAWGLSQSGGVIGASGQIGSTIKVRKPSYSRQALGHTAPVPFQRVGATPTDYDAIGFPKYLRLDGTDDFYTCSGGGSATGFYYSDMIRPMGGAGTRRVIWSDRSGNNGYELAINTSDKLEFSAGNGTTITTVASTVSAAVSDGKRYEVMDDGTNLSVQIDGSAPVTVARPVVTAGSPTITLYRGASTGYFNGQITEPIYRAGPPPSAYERGVIRAYQMQKAGL